MDQIPVVAAVIWRDGRVLLGRRPDDKRHGGLWEFPGGKIQRDETNLDAVRRELTEELRLETISVSDTLYESRDSGSPFVIRFVEVEVRGEPLALEHEELRWVEPGALTALRLAPCDTRFVVEHLLESLA
jgi:8-oxo-dGTP diphosphatase